MEIVNVDLILGRRKTELIRRSVRYAFLQARPPRPTC